MFEKLLTVFKIPELRRKILLTLVLLAVYRMGFWIPLPFIDQDRMQYNIEKMQQGGEGGVGQVMQIVALFSASRIGNATIFGLGIMPYISASIIFQLLGSVYAPLQRLQKEGEAGRRKLNEYTRYATVLICLGQSYMWIKGLSSGAVAGSGLILEDYDFFAWHIVGTVTMTAGTILLMWIGEQIDAYGIGNGISLLIMAGILAQMPIAGSQLLGPAFVEGVPIGSEAGIEKLLLLAGLFVFVIVWVIAITQGQRRIPIQSAKHVRGRRVHGGQRQSLPLKVNQAGVMPIIFASSLLMFPYFLFHQLSAIWPENRVLAALDAAFIGRGYIYNLCYVGLIYFFCYFWTAITFNPSDIANNLKDYGSFIPGYRPGARTAQYLEQVMSRITYVGAAFLALIAVIPTIVATSMGINYLIASFYGGTGLLIVVSVALDLVNKIDSHLLMRNYPGLLEAEKK
ncbi:MAG: preprotein translocase subunit SecY [Planctomycetaceae bacterium]|nr:preprotein translocase subunit SecY [Planctomycetaceae bacterium]